LVLVELLPRLKSESLLSWVRAVDSRTKEARDHQLPGEFWEQVQVWSGDHGLEVDWSRWLRNRKEVGIPEWWPSDGSRFFSYYFYVEAEYLNRHWPDQSVADQSAATDVSTRQRKPGPQPKYDWKQEVATELFAIVAANGGKIPVNDHAIARKLLRFCSKKWDWEPSDAAMRALIAQLLARARNLG
jgi:hypothetical protein